MKGLFTMMGVLFFILFVFLFVGGPIFLFVAIKYSTQLKTWWSTAKSNSFLRLFILLILLVFLIIPLLLVDQLVNERSSRYHSVLNEIGEEWGAPQRCIGPFLVVPYEYTLLHQEKTKNKVGDVETKNRIETVHTQAIFLPDQLNFNAQLNPEYRYRSIYQSLVYTAQLKVEGQFPMLTFKRLTHPPSKIYWEKSYLSFGLSDTRAIKRAIELKWAERSYDFSSGPQFNLLRSGIHAPLELNAEESQRVVKFSFSLNFNGSQRFEWAPVGKMNDVQVTSSWTSPSFRGNFLPESREISEDGFTARWRVPSLARAYPQSWESESFNQRNDLHSFHGGVHLFEPVHIYTKVSRSIKYGFLFLGLTLLSLILVERSTKRLLHFIHYGLTAFALVIFYLLILSVAEHWGFDFAYLIAASVVTLTVGLYHIPTFKQPKIALFNSFILMSLYIILFVILQLQDFALLVGSLLLLFVLWIVMYQTRNVSVAQDS
jgi:inner membrane protein